ncbi:TolC family protein [Geomonas sp.]|uniref:TolC family protein n=1 Tax=Geomonas sp. TaxID=2651584 RepID=UPI002B469357|nr:TolC family protein [Geomonas sp.]HJV35800.1 TolC family protein [Geomonas sp.]
MRRFHIGLAALTVSALLGAAVQAAEVPTPVDLSRLSLDQALTLGDARNRDIQKAKEFYNEVEGRYLQERAAALPQLSLVGQATASGDESQRVYGRGFPTDQRLLSSQVQLSQTLFTWGKVGAAIRAAAKARLTADEQLRIARQDTRRDVTVAFYDVVLAREQQGFALQNREQKRRHQDEAERKYAAGVATDYDLLAAKVSVENANPEVIRSANTLKTAKDRLRYILALEAAVDVTGSLEPPVYAVPAFADAMKTALERRPELRELRHRKEIAEELIKVAKADDKPRVDFNGAYGYRRLDTGASDGEGQAWSAGVSLTFPFFDGMRTRGKVAQAVSQRSSLEIDEAKLADAIALEVREAINQVEEAREIMNSLTGTVTQAERLLAMAEKGYELGVKIRLEVEDAELNLLQARNNLARAKRDFLVAKTQMERVEGILGE